MKLYLAAYETQWMAAKGLLRVPKTAPLFLTYYYADKTTKCLPSLKPHGHTGTLTIDSGAHSFFGHTGNAVTSSISKSRKKAMPNPQEYFDQYADWLSANHHLFDYFVELDLQEIVGQAVVDKWLSEYAARGIGHKCIMVHHSCQKWNEFEKIVDQSPSRYVGIEGIRPNTQMLPYVKFIRHAYEKRCGIHGFAFTRQDLLKVFPFYSVDSSSWTTPVRYGGIPVFNGVRLSNKTGSDHERLRNVALQHRLSTHHLGHARSPEQYASRLETSAKAYLELGKFINDLWAKRGIV